MKTVFIGGKTYAFSDAVRDHPVERTAFNSLAKEVFGLDFEPWRQGGWWGQRYLPYTLFDGERAAANISVNLMDFSLEGRVRRYIQIGTVMTAPAERGRGLSRWLMERVLNQWRDRCDGVYLFANETVLDFYPRFGFEKAGEWEAALPLCGGTGSARKLSMDSAEDKALLLRRYGQSNSRSAFGMEHNPGLLMFYCDRFLKDCIYEVPEAGAVVVAEQTETGLFCHDIFGGKGSIEEIVSAVAAQSSPVRFGFMPKETAGFTLSKREQADDALFVLRGKENPCTGRKLLFPTLSHA